MVRRILLVATMVLGFAGGYAQAVDTTMQGSPSCMGEVKPVCIGGKPVCVCLDYAKVDCIWACR